MFKLIAIDLDGTLLNDKKEITKDNLSLINKLIQFGYEVVIATGRRYYSAKELTKSIDSHMTILANNGNIVRRSEDDRILFSSYMDNVGFKQIIQEGKSRNLQPIVHVDYFTEGYDMVVQEDFKHDEYMDLFPKNEKRLKVISQEDLNDIDRVLAIVYAGDQIPLVSFNNYIVDNYPNLYNSHVIGDIDIAEAMLEIMNPQGSKWKSLLKYAKSLGIVAEEIIVIGDNNNDLEMVLNAGLGIAMKNGSKEIKQVSDIITAKDNNQSGVAFELKRVLNI